MMMAPDSDFPPTPARPGATARHDKDSETRVCTRHPTEGRLGDSEAHGPTAGPARAHQSREQMNRPGRGQILPALCASRGAWGGWTGRGKGGSRSAGRWGAAGSAGARKLTRTAGGGPSRGCSRQHPAGLRSPASTPPLRGTPPPGSPAVGRPCALCADRLCGACDKGLKRG
jgi:hypothetical protein